MLRKLITGPIWNALAKLAFEREPDVYIGGREDTYLERWWLIPRNPVFNVYLHHFLRSDDDRALHDHPWVNLSILLAGSYTEHTIAAGGVNVRTERRAGDMKLRSPLAAHRVELTDGACWTLFITGPRIRDWGFHCRKGWVSHKAFVHVDGKDETVGSGCGDLA
jgi:hypothetical protein